MRNTQRKGDVGLAKAIAKFTELECDVSLPITESAAYDLVVDYNGKLFRVQARYSQNKCVELRRIHVNTKGTIVKKTVENAYDWLYVYSPCNGEYLFKQCFHNRSSVNLQEEFRLTENGACPAWTRKSV